MASIRKTRVVRIWEDGNITEPNLDHSSSMSYVDVKQFKKVTVETGKGPSFQRSVFTLRWFDLPSTVDAVLDGGAAGDAKDRKWDVKFITNPANPGQGIFVPVLKIVATENGTSTSFQRSKWTFDNTTQNNKRVTHTRTLNKDFNDRDAGGTLDVAVIDKFITENGRGPSYQKRVFTYVNTDADEHEDVE